MFAIEVAKVTSKGQITIPVSIRRRLNINEGDKILFIDRPDGVIMVNPDMFQQEQDLSVSAVRPGVRPSVKVSERASERPAIRATVPDKEYSPVISMSDTSAEDDEYTVEEATAYSPPESNIEPNASIVSAPKVRNEVPARNEAPARSDVPEKSEDPAKNEDPAKSGETAKRASEYDVAALLNEIRSIGSKI